MRSTMAGRELDGSVPFVASAHRRADTAGEQLRAGAESVAAAVDAVDRALLAAAGAEGWPTAARHGALEAVDRATSMLTALRARLLAAEQAAGTWALHGDRSLAAWRARTSRQGTGAGAAQVRQADAVSTMPRVADALASGAVTATHLDAIARMSTGSREVVRHVASDEGQAHLVALAERLDGAAYAKALAQWQAELDRASRQRAHDEQQAARHLHLSHTSGGTVLKGLVDRVAGHRLQLALEAVSPRPALDDDRSPEQRRADALVTLADRALDDPATGTGAAVRPHVSLLVSESTWTSLRRPERLAPERGRRSASAGTTQDARTLAGGTIPVDEALAGGTTNDADTWAAGTRRDAGAQAGGAIHVARALAGHPAICDEDGSPWPASEVARVLCDCRLSRIVMGADSVPLDLGRTHRLFTGAQRRAATIRDGGCGWPSCPAAARWCELHHIRWWDGDGGSSDLENAVLLCSYHHHLVHRRELTITRLPRATTAPAPREEHPRVRYRFTDRNGGVLTEPRGAFTDPGSPGDEPGSAVTRPRSALTRARSPVTGPRSAVTGPGDGVTDVRSGVTASPGAAVRARPRADEGAARRAIPAHAARAPAAGPGLRALSAP